MNIFIAYPSLLCSGRSHDPWIWSQKESRSSNLLILDIKFITVQGEGREKNNFCRGRGLTATPLPPPLAVLSRLSSKTLRCVAVCIYLLDPN